MLLLPEEQGLLVLEPRLELQLEQELDLARRQHPELSGHMPRPGTECKGVAALCGRQGR